MDKRELAQLLTQYHHRELPKNYVLLSPAAEVAALLKEHALEKQSWDREMARQEKERDQLLAQVTNLAYLLDEAVTRFQGSLEEMGLKRMYRELRVLKDKLVQMLEEAGYIWHDPIGERFDDELPELVSVDGWRYGPEYEEEYVAQVREPIVLRDGIPIKEGSVVVGAPEVQKQVAPGASDEPVGGKLELKNKGTSERIPVATEPGNEEAGSDEIEAEQPADN